MRKNNEPAISANEINKYTYCPYQWYYEKIYGAKELRRLKKELNERLNLEDATMSNFVSGQKFHNKHKYFDVNKLVAGMLTIAVIAAMAALAFGKYVIR